MKKQRSSPAPSYRGEIAVAIDDAARARSRDRWGHRRGGARSRYGSEGGRAFRRSRSGGEHRRGLDLEHAPRAGDGHGGPRDGWRTASSSPGPAWPSSPNPTSPVRGAPPVAPSATKMPSWRRNMVDPLALKPGDYVVHAQHGIGKYIDLVSRTSGGAVREYLVVEYAPSKRGPSGRPTLRADRRARPALALHRRRGAHREQARWCRLGEDEGPRAQGGARHRRETGAALRGPCVGPRSRLRAGHPVAAGARGRLPVHRDGRPDGRHRRGQGRHGEGRRRWTG